MTSLAGSGKSSTLAALVNAINEQKAVEIHTIENPPAYRLPAAEEGMQCFDDVLIKLLRSAVLDLETVREFAVDLLEDPLEPMARAIGLKPNGRKAG